MGANKSVNDGPNAPKRLVLNIDRRTLVQSTEIAKFRGVSRAEWLRQAIRFAVRREYEFRRGPNAAKTWTR